MKRPKWNDLQSKIQKKKDLVRNYHNVLSNQKDHTEMNKFIYWTMTLNDDSIVNSKDLLAFSQRCYDQALIKHEFDIEQRDNNKILSEDTFVDADEGTGFSNVMTQIYKLVLPEINQYKFYLITQGTIKNEETGQKKQDTRYRVKLTIQEFDDKYQLKDDCKQRFWLSDWSKQKNPDIRVPMYALYNEYICFYEH